MKLELGTYKVIQDYTRNKRGQFAAINWKRIERRVLLGIVIVSMTVIGGGMATNNFAFLDRWFVPLEYVAVAEAAELRGQPDKIEAAKWKVIDELEKCESGGHIEDEGFVRMDNNDTFSWGTLQFQRHTILHYMKKIHGKEITLKEAAMIALDRVEARQLAYDIIFRTDRGVAADWVICSRNYQLQTKVDLLKSL